MSWTFHGSNFLSVVKSTLNVVIPTTRLNQGDTVGSISKLFACCFDYGSNHRKVMKAKHSRQIPWRLTAHLVSSIILML